MSIKLWELPANANHFRRCLKYETFGVALFLLLFVAGVYFRVESNATTVIEVAAIAGILYLWESAKRRLTNKWAEVDDCLAAGFNSRKGIDSYRYSIEQYSKAISIDPKYAWSYVLRGIALNNLGQYDRAIADLTVAVKLCRLQPMAYLVRGAVYQDQGQYQKAIWDLTIAGGICCSHWWDVYEILKVQKKVNREHRRTLKKILKLDSASTIDYVRSQQTSQELEWHRITIHECTKAIKQEPCGVTFLERGAVYFATGQYSEAIMDYTSGLRHYLDTGYGWGAMHAYRERATAYHATGDHQQFAADTMKAANLAKELERHSRVMAGKYKQKARDYLKELRKLHKYLARYPHSLSQFVQRGHIYWELGQYEKALADYSKAISLGDRRASTFESRGDAHLELQHYEQAIEDYSSALDGQFETLNRITALIYKKRGDAYRAQERYQNSVADYCKAIILSRYYCGIKSLTILSQRIREHPDWLEDAYLRLGDVAGRARQSTKINIATNY